jgi:hypothetical protein
MRDPQNLPGWLFNTVRYTVKNIRRMESRRQRRELKATLTRNQSQSSGSITDPSDVLDDAVARLSALDRQAVLLRFYQNRSFPKVAEALEITEAAGRKRVSRAVEALRHRLGKDLGVASVSVAALSGLNQRPPDLCRVAADIALRAKAGTPISASIASAAKGSLFLMATAKIKIAGLVLLALLVLLVPAVLFKFISSPAAAPYSPADVALPGAPAPIEQSPDPYTLGSGQVLKRLAEVPLPTRNTFFHKLPDIGLAGNSPSLPVTIAVGYKSGLFQEWTWDFDHPFTLAALVEYLLDFCPQQTEGIDATQAIPGDFVFNTDTSVDQRRAALQQILNSELGLPVTLTVRRVERTVIVLQGQWRYSPPSSPRAADNRVAPSLEFYEKTINPQPVNAGAGDPKRFAGELGKYINEQIVIEATGVPDSFFWAYDEPRDQEHDLTLVLNHITEQTGLTWSKQKRLVDRLFIERQDATPTSAGTTGGSL